MSAEVFLGIGLLIGVIILSVIIAASRAVRRPDPYAYAKRCRHVSSYDARSNCYRCNLCGVMTVDLSDCSGCPECDWCGLPVRDDQTVRVDLKGMTMHERCAQSYQLWSDALGQVFKKGDDHRVEVTKQ